MERYSVPLFQSAAQKIGKAGPSARFRHLLTALPPCATNRACFDGVPRLGCFVFLRACPFGNILRGLRRRPESSQKPSFLMCRLLEPWQL